MNVPQSQWLQDSYIWKSILDSSLEQELCSDSFAIIIINVGTPISLNYFVKCIIFRWFAKCAIILLNMGQSRPLFIYIRPFLIPIAITISIQIDKSIDGVLSIWTRGRRMVGTGETTELWRPTKCNYFTYVEWTLSRIGKNLTQKCLDKS